MENIVIVVLSSSVIATLISLGVTWLWRRSDIKAQQHNLAMSLKDEICALVSIYENYKMPEKIPLSRIDIGMVDLSFAYPIVYENNADKIGILESKDAEEIIMFYVSFKKLTEAMKILDEHINNYKAIISNTRNDRVVLEQNLCRPFEELKIINELVENRKKAVFEKKESVIKLLDKYK